MLRGFPYGLASAAIILGVIVAFSGARWTFTERANSSLWGGYEPGQVLRLNFDVFIVDTSAFGWPDRWALVPAASVKLPYGRHFLSPSTIDAYKEQGTFPPEEWAQFGITGLSPPEVMGIAEQGTKVEIKQLRRTVGWSPWAGGAFTTVSVWGDLLDGPYAGLRVDMEDLSTSEKVDGVFLASPYDLVFDPKYYWDGELSEEMCAAERHPREPISGCD